MKLGYRDRIILLVACIIIVFCIGIFVFIKPKWETLTKNEKTLTDLEQKWEVQLSQFEGIPNMQTKIENKYNKGVELSKEFTPEMDAIQLDQFLQEKFMNTDTHIAHDVRATGSVSFTDQGTASIPYYYYTPNIVTYPLYQTADMDGSLAKAAAEKRKESDTLASRAVQTAGAGRSNLIIHTTREDLMNLLGAVHDYAKNNKDTMIINSVAISDYTFGLKPGEILTIPEEIEKDEEGNIVPSEMKVELSEATFKKESGAAANTNTNQNDKDEVRTNIGYADVVITYEVYYMQEPMKPDVGPAYDPTIWDGDSWKDYTAAE